MRSWKDIIAQLSKEFDLHPKVVEENTMNYWRLIRTLLSNPNKDPVRVEGIGSWPIKYSNFFKLLAKQMIALRLVKANKFYGDVAISKQKEATSLFKKLWQLKQELKLINTSKKKSPKQLVNEILDEQ